jgi:hypothetical protein
VRFLPVVRWIVKATGQIGSTERELIMLRRFLAGMALTGAALIPTVSAAHAAPAKAAFPPISASLCILGGGQVIPAPLSLTGLICVGGRFHGLPVIR